MVIVAIVPYASTLGFDFVWDDPHLIDSRLEVRGMDDLVRIWKTPFLTEHYFRPVTWYSLAVDWATGADNPRGYHAQNVLWHAAACLFLWLLAWEISGRPIAAAAGTVLFALHPTHPENVAFVSGRTDLIAAAFFFGALWAAARFGPGIRSPWLKLLPATLVLVPGLLAKEVALFGAPLLPLALGLRDRRIGLPDVVRASALVAGVALLFLALRANVVGPSTLPKLAMVEGTVPQILTSFAIVARYLALLLVPVDLAARHELLPKTAPDLTVLVGLLAVIAIAVGIAWTWRRRSPWLLPLVLFAVTLLPLCWVRLLAGALVAERYLYIPSGAIALAVALLPGVLVPRERRRAKDALGTQDAGLGFLLGAGAVAAVLFALLVPRVAVWRNGATLYASMLRDEPDSPHVHGLAGGYYHRQGDLPRAAQHYRRAYALYPASGEMLLNLVGVMDEAGQPDSAFVYARHLLAEFPQYAAAWYAFGNLYVRVDQSDSARMAYEEALRLDPTLAQAENNLGAVLERLGRYDEAMAHYRRAGEIIPGMEEAAKNVARLTPQMDSLRAAARLTAPSVRP